VETRENYKTIKKEKVLSEARTQPFDELYRSIKTRGVYKIAEIVYV